MADRNRYEISVLAKMWRRNLFGEKYEPVERLMSDIPRERRDKAKESLESLHKDGLIIFHKGKKCASINTNYKQKIREILEEEIPDYVLDLR